MAEPQSSVNIQPQKARLNFSSNSGGGGGVELHNFLQRIKMYEQPTVQPQSNVLGILSIVFAILGIFFLGIVFVPLAFLCAITATYQAVKKQASLVIAILAWILTIVGLITSPVLLATIGISAS